MPRWNADRELVWREAGRGMRQVDEWARQAREDPHVGYCVFCGEGRRRSQCEQVERDETCVYACLTCGKTVNEDLPF